MTSAELIKVCKQFEEEHGIADTLLLLNDIIVARAQANSMDIEYYDDEEGDPVEDRPIH